MPNQLRWILLSVLIIILDQTSKWFVSQNLIINDPHAVTSFFNIILEHNSGAAFGFLRFAGGWQRWLFGIIAVVISAVIIVLLAKLPRNKNWLACAMALVLGGALGNLIDRIIFGYVIDFFDFHINNWHFATFNVADTAISIGVAMWILSSLTQGKKS